MSKQPGESTKMRTLGLVILVISAALYLVLLLPSLGYLNARFTTQASEALGSWLGLASDLEGTGIAIADRIYVVSLKTREDRRAQMNILAKRLGLRMSYVDAVPSTDNLVNATLKWVNESRTSNLNTLGDGFRWPTDIDTLATSEEYLDYWDSTNSPDLDDPSPLASSNSIIPVATGDHTTPSNTTRLPDYMVLSPSRIACWHSHLSLIHRVANTPSLSQRLYTTLILEDDVDMEQDINAELSHLWEYLPTSWDVVFLGHCWSNESFHAPLVLPQPYRHNISISTISPPSTHRIHPSLSPKCTHAYALSRIGARRLLLHLRYPPFAYSRAIDQAIAWLVRTGRLKSFSIVPSLVIQRKVLKSDVWAGGGLTPFGDARGPDETTAAGSSWRERLTHGAFD